MSTLKDTADAINAAIKVAKDSGARLEMHGSILVLREGTEVYALGATDNGEIKFVDVYPRAVPV